MVHTVVNAANAVQYKEALTHQAVYGPGGVQLHDIQHKKRSTNTDTGHKQTQQWVYLNGQAIASIVDQWNSAPSTPNTYNDTEIRYTLNDHLGIQKVAVTQVGSAITTSEVIEKSAFGELGFEGADVQRFPG